MLSITGRLLRRRYTHAFTTFVLQTTMSDWWARACVCGSPCSAINLYHVFDVCAYFSVVFLNKFSSFAHLFNTSFTSFNLVREYFCGVNFFPLWFMWSIDMDSKTLPLQRFAFFCLNCHTVLNKYIYSCTRFGFESMASDWGLDVKASFEIEFCVSNLLNITLWFVKSICPTLCVLIVIFYSSLSLPLSFSTTMLFIRIPQTTF